MKKGNDNTGRVLRQQLLAFLAGGNAHMDYNSAIAGFPMKEMNRRVPNGSYTIWHLLEHMRIVQWDILEFVRNPDHVSPDFPAGYWPAEDRMGTPEEWRDTAKAFRADLKAFRKVVTDPKTDLFSPIPHAPDYTVIREVLLVGDHNAFHVGEFVAVRRVLNLKPVKEY
jgi:hypothetical protein